MRHKVLLTEDEPNLIYIMEQVFTANGYDVLTATSGAQGLDVYHKEAPEFIITDWMMPIMDGLEFVKRLRLSDKRTPVLILTGKTSEEDAVKGYECGANCFVRKPFSMKEIMAIVASYFSLSASSGHSRETLAIGTSTSLDPVSQTLAIAGNVVQLTNMEYSVLETLALNKNNTVTTASLLSRLWNDDVFSSANLHVYISKLRAILKEDESISLLNLRGVGYKLIDSRQ